MQARRLILDPAEVREDERSVLAADRPTVGWRGHFITFNVNPRLRVLKDLHLGHRRRMVLRSQLLSQTRFVFSRIVLLVDLFVCVMTKMSQLSQTIQPLSRRLGLAIVPLCVEGGTGAPFKNEMF